MRRRVRSAEVPTASCGACGVLVETGYSGLGSRIEQLLRLAEQERQNVLVEARAEAAGIHEEARRQAEQILAEATTRAGQIYSAGSAEDSR